MKVTKTIWTNSFGDRVISYFKDGEHHGDIIRRKTGRRFDVIGHDFTVRAIKSRCQAELALFSD